MRSNTSYLIQVSGAEELIRHGLHDYAVYTDFQFPSYTGTPSNLPELMLTNSPPIVGEGQGVGSVFRNIGRCIRQMSEITDPTPTPPLEGRGVLCGSLLFREGLGSSPLEGRGVQQLY